MPDAIIRDSTEGRKQPDRRGSTAGRHLCRASTWCSLSLVSRSKQRSWWQHWVQRPQRLWFRRALFQVHLWSGLGLGLYVLMISVTGSVLVYRNELFRAATAKPVISKGSQPRLTDAALAEAAKRRYPGYAVVRIGRPRNPDQAADVWLSQGTRTKKRLFDPRTGEDVGPSVPAGIWMVSKLLDLHDNLLAGSTGRTVNGLGALSLLLLAGTGLAIWWPGTKTWRRSLIVPRGVGWRRATWHLHSMIGFWTLAFTVIFGLSGLYLGIPQPFEDLVDRLEPPTPVNAGRRIGDRVVYWLAYLHFGRVNGIGIPCSGRGLCDQATKLTWALFGLAPAVMFVTGAILWWTRVLRPRRRAVRTGEGVYSTLSGGGMKRRFVTMFVAVIAACMAGAPARAHHSFAAAYDMKQPITVHGTIVQVLLRNPHSWFVLNVKDANGKMEEWAFEAGTPSGMIRNGYKASIIKPGAEVTIKGFRARDASQTKGMLRELTTADGQVFGLFGPQESK